jgi:predicted Zn-dependent protease
MRRPWSRLRATIWPGRSAVKLRDNDLASDYLREVLKWDAGNPLLTEKVFLLEVSEGNLPKAESYAEEVLKFNSQQRMARIVLGLRDFRARHYADARKEFPGGVLYPRGRTHL